MASMFNIASVKNMVDEVRAQVYPSNETEKKVYEALSSKNWGASSSTLNELANDTYDYEKYKIITEIVWRNLNTEGKNWRQVFKTMTFIEFMIKNGAERFIEDCRDRLSKIRTLQDYNFYEDNVDKGSGVREKSKLIIELLSNNDHIRSEREKARALRNKFVGIDSRNGGGSYGGNYGNGGYSGNSDNFSGGGGGRYDSYDSGSRYGQDSRRGSDLNAGNGGRYGGGAYDSSKPPRFSDDDVTSNQEYEEAKVVASSRSASSGTTSTGGKLKVSIKKVAGNNGKPAEADLMPTSGGGEIDLLGGFESASSTSAAEFDPFGANTNPTSSFDPFGSNTSNQVPSVAFDPFSAPVAAPIPPSSTPNNFANFSNFSAPAPPAPSSGFNNSFGGFSQPISAPAQNFSPAPAFQPAPYQQQPQPVYSQPQIPSISSTSHDADFGDFEAAPVNNRNQPAVAQKWGDLSSLVDLGKLEKNDSAVPKQQSKSNAPVYDSFAGLDGFTKTPQSMTAGANRAMMSAQPAMLPRATGYQPAGNSMAPMGAPMGGNYGGNMGMGPPVGMGAPMGMGMGGVGMSNMSPSMGINPNMNMPMGMNPNMNAPMGMMNPNVNGNFQPPYNSGAMNAGYGSNAYQGGLNQPMGFQPNYGQYR